MTDPILPPIPSYTCRRATSPITIDGALDEPTWKHAEQMQLVETVTGDEPRYPTVVRALWDDRYLYVGFEAEDPYIWGTLKNRDEPLWDEEVVEVFLDDDCNEWSFLEFEVSPNNVIVDLAVLPARRQEPRAFVLGLPGLADGGAGGRQGELLRRYRYLLDD